MKAPDIARKLEEIPAGSAIGIDMKIESYFDFIRATLDLFATRKDLDCIYVTSTIPSESILNALSVLEVDTQRVHFVDCISHSMMGKTSQSERVIFVESATMLENIMLKVQYLMKKSKKEGKMVIIDSVNTLAIHNNTKILSEFFHILLNNLRSQDAYVYILNIEGQGSEELDNMMNLVTDDRLIITTDEEEEVNEEGREEEKTQGEEGVSE